MLGLLANLGILLERVGTNPPERLGTAASYGRKVQYIVKARLTQALQAYAKQNEQAPPLPPTFEVALNEFGGLDQAPLTDPKWMPQSSTGQPLPGFTEPNEIFEQLCRESAQQSKLFGSICQ